MDAEVKKQLEELHALVKDNHRLLRAVRRHQLLETFGKLVFWLIVFAASGYAYLYYLAPVVQKFVEHPSATTFGFPSSADLQKLIDSSKTK